MQGSLPAMGFPVGAAPSHSPTLTSCGAGSSGGKGNPRKYLQEAGEAAQGSRSCRDGCVSLSPVCGCDLAQSGFFFKNQEYICTHDYQQLYGTRCDSCGDFITGEVISALGRTYHPKCFVCSTCR